MVENVDIANASTSKETIDRIVGLQNAVAFTASVERIFSIFGLVHSKLRTRLGIEKAGKLVFFYRMFNK